MALYQCVKTNTVEEITLEDLHTYDPLVLLPLSYNYKDVFACLFLLTTFFLLIFLIIVTMLYIHVMLFILEALVIVGVVC